MIAGWRKRGWKSALHVAAAGLCYGSVGLAAEPMLDQAGRLVGRWESFSIVSTNSPFDQATKVTLTVRPGKSSGPEAELMSTGAARYHDLAPQVSGPIHATENTIVIGSGSRVGFQYGLTNGVLTIEWPRKRQNDGVVHGFKIELRLADSAPEGNH